MRKANTIPFVVALSCLFLLPATASADAILQVKPMSGEAGEFWHPKVGENILIVVMSDAEYGWPRLKFTYRPNSKVPKEEFYEDPQANPKLPTHLKAEQVPELAESLAENKPGYFREIHTGELRMFRYAPTRPGIMLVTFEADFMPTQPDGKVVTRQMAQQRIAVRFDGVPPSGMGVMAFAAFVLFGGVFMAARALTKGSGE